MEVLDEQPQNKLEQAIAQGYVFRFGDYIGQAIDLFKKEAGLFILYTLLALIIGSIPFLYLHVIAGYCAASRRVQRGEKLEFEHFFEGFQGENFAPLLLASLVTLLMVMIGLFLCILPGIYLAVGYIFTAPIILWHTKDFWQAMELSRKVVTKQWLMVFLFLIVVGLLAQLGVLACCVGLLVTLPIYYVAIYCSYADIAGEPLQ